MDNPMPRTIRIFAIVSAVLSGLLGIAVAVLSVLILTRNPEIVMVIKQTYKGFFTGATGQEEDALIQLIGTIYVGISLLSLLAIGADVAVAIMAKSSTSRNMGLALAIIAIVFGQLVPGILFIAYSASKPRKVNSVEPKIS